MSIFSDENEKVRKNDRVIILGPVEGKKAVSSTGIVDTRLFTGENKLHAVRDPQSSLWRMKYEMGSVPDELRQSFTNFEKLLAFAKTYYAKRNIEIKEVID